MKKINFDTLFKIILLLMFSIYYIIIIFTNKITNYVHPRIIPVASLAAILMAVTAFLQVPSLFSITRKKLRLSNYILFIIPILFIISFQDSNNISSTYNSATEKSSNENSSSNEVSTNKIGLDINNINTSKLNIQNNTIKVTPQNFVFTLDEILNNPDKYYGCNIEITGFVYRDNNSKQNEFIICRYMMVCCAADMQLAGIKCINNTSHYKNDTWIKISGKIEKDPDISEDAPIIVTQFIEEDHSPDTSYVYPY